MEVTHIIKVYSNRRATAAAPIPALAPITGEIFTTENLRSIRPGYGLEPKYINSILGQKARQDIKRGTPLTWQLIKN